MPRQISAAALVLVLLRVGALCASAAGFAAALPASVTLQRMPFRFLLGARAIVAAYSGSKVASAACEVTRGVTVYPEDFQLWFFDFAYDQGLGYMVLAAAATAARDVAGCGGGQEGWMSGNGAAAACVRAQVAVWLGFLGFAFMAVAALITSFRVTRFLVTGSGFPPPPPPPPASS